MLLVEQRLAQLHSMQTLHSYLVPILIIYRELYFIQLGCQVLMYILIPILTCGWLMIITAGSSHTGTGQQCILYCTYMGPAKCSYFYTTAVLQPRIQTVLLYSHFCCVVPVLSHIPIDTFASDRSLCATHPCMYLPGTSLSLYILSTYIVPHLPMYICIYVHTYMYLPDRHLSPFLFLQICIYLLNSGRGSIQVCTYVQYYVELCTYSTCMQVPRVGKHTYTYIVSAAYSLLAWLTRQVATRRDAIIM